MAKKVYVGAVATVLGPHLGRRLGDVIESENTPLAVGAILANGYVCSAVDAFVYNLTAGLGRRCFAPKKVHIAYVAAVCGRDLGRRLGDVIEGENTPLAVIAIPAPSYVRPAVDAFGLNRAAGLGGHFSAPKRAHIVYAAAVCGRDLGWGVGGVVKGEDFSPAVGTIWTPTYRCPAVPAVRVRAAVPPGGVDGVLLDRIQLLPPGGASGHGLVVHVVVIFGPLLVVQLTVHLVPAVFAVFLQAAFNDILRPAVLALVGAAEMAGGGVL